METLLIVGIVIVVLGFVVAVVHFASRPPKEAEAWDRDDNEDYEDDWDEDYRNDRPR
ncbi:hypothetical protein OHA40_07280 [Nocardia sp. NBC_00508]|uniref:hypothetical protein n=1 Tax=Nocardia sp. NBC_00508 TaxID=2975992 RepID=UPI002E81D559|nr:hypothetical protein [Nocardia sp. NBC_00508]WUD67919.1 hypothetical protein OHA40_07280 [Nocardia sp. NBC_00508]